MAMMNASLYSLPFPQSNLKCSTSPQKRKRHENAGNRKEVVDQFHETQDGSLNTEYTSILTPIERMQRRLAGQTLNKEPPSFPFPHAPLSSSDRSNPNDNGDDELESGMNSKRRHKVSLREQHIATITAIIHKSLNTKNYRRASRAFALLLRTEIAGNTVDLRNCGLWEIGAEILLYRDTSYPTDFISRDAFEKVKAYYNRLALQFPWQTRWSSMIDMQEFKSAMFSLWIHTVCAESRRMQSVDNLDDSDLSQSSSRAVEQAKRWELNEAEKIAKELDSLMNTIPFVDNLELLRLRAMVALWLADLFELIDQSPNDLENTDSAANYNIENVLAAEIDAEENLYELSSQRKQVSKRTNDARNFASTLFARLENREGNNSEGQDSSEENKLGSMD